LGITRKANVCLLIFLFVYIFFSLSKVNNEQVKLTQDGCSKNENNTVEENNIWLPQINVWTVDVKCLIYVTSP